MSGYDLNGNGAIDPDEYQRMLAAMLPITAQAESGNRDYYANGQPVRSPAGAMFRMQVLPSTARNPGFGITPAASQTPGEYNRVGEQLLAKMGPRYGYDPAKMWAAYHSGPGTVDRLSGAGPQWQQRLGPQGRSYVANNTRALGQSGPQASTTPQYTVNEAPMPEQNDTGPLTTFSPGEDASSGGPLTTFSPSPSGPDNSLNGLLAQQNEIDKERLKLRQQVLDNGIQGLQAKRHGLSPQEWFALSAAFAQPSRVRGFAGMMGNVTPVLAQIAAAHDPRDRDAQLARLRQDYASDTLDDRDTSLKTRVGIAEKLATLNKAEGPDKGTLGSDGVWHRRDRPMQTKNAITSGGVTYNQWDDGNYRRINADGTRTVYVLEGDTLRKIGTEPASGGQ